MTLITDKLSASEGTFYSLGIMRLSRMDLGTKDHFRPLLMLIN